MDPPDVGADGYYRDPADCSVSAGRPLGGQPREDCGKMDVFAWHMLSWQMLHMLTFSSNCEHLPGQETIDSGHDLACSCSCTERWLMTVSVVRNIGLSFVAGLAAEKPFLVRTARR
ncbi:hypothetical protein Bbelb_349570 [Branchiostoma belcheri]|nr:hypothetical protein Bbelb_349570 [Branchiostoma belcheri]